MLETVKMQKTIRADKEAIWSEVLKAGFAKNFLPEIKSTRTNSLPTYSIPGKLLSWYNIGSTSIEMAKTDLKSNIESIELELIPKGNETIVQFIVNLNNKFDVDSFKRQNAIQALFNIKLTVLKQDLEQNQVTWSPVYS